MGVSGRVEEQVRHEGSGWRRSGDEGEMGTRLLHKLKSRHYSRQNRRQAPRKPVIPAKAGIHFIAKVSGFPLPRE